MMVEAIHLYRLIVIVFGSEKDFTKIYYCIGWGIPTLISAIVLGVGHDKFGVDGRCWLTTKRGFIWAFLVPVLLIITVNSIVLGIVIQKTVKASKVSAENNIDVVKTGVRSAIMLLPMLGIVWILGIVGNWTMIMAYIFDIINSCQGVWLVLVCCYFNSEVRGAMQTQWNKAFGSKISSKESGTYATHTSTRNQTTTTDMAKVD
ncbi:adhesion G-protein coupled receptor D1-like [Amphiura filiformis]|uniref:adhesion G-protein coupled receptor D1-like n=1 Tax=Amphiura filiformis TaxID=82378 RepID=UPI003B21E048